MTSKEKIDLALPFIDSLFPNAKCELFYSKDYELAIAVMLSAQTTDKAVNKATEKLFKDFPTLESFANGKLENIEKDIEDTIEKKQAGALIYKRLNKIMYQIVQIGKVML